MARYIDKARVIGVLNQFKKEHSNLPSACLKMIDIALNIIKQIPTADVVEVVRCEKCKDFESHGNGKAGICRNKKLKPCLRYATDFCSYGERKQKNDFKAGVL